MNLNISPSVYKMYSTFETFFKKLQHFAITFGSQIAPIPVKIAIIEEIQLLFCYNEQGSIS